MALRYRALTAGVFCFQRTSDHAAANAGARPDDPLLRPQLRALQDPAGRVPISVVLAALAGRLLSDATARVLGTRRTRGRSMKAPARSELRESRCATEHALRESGGATEHATVPGGATEHAFISPLPGGVAVCSTTVYGRFSSQR